MAVRAAKKKETGQWAGLGANGANGLPLNAFSGSTLWPSDPKVSIET